MTKPRTILLGAAVSLLLGCGPSCPEVKAALDTTAAITGDVTRINDLVARRKAAMAEAEQGGHSTFHMQRLKFSVTAFEIAIQTQARIVKASPRFEDAPSYGESAGVINTFRCYLDKLLAADGHLLPDGVGKRLREFKVEIEGRLGRDGAVNSAELRSYYEQGIAAPEASDEGDGTAPDTPEEPLAEEDAED
jgi:hypothetical protein